MYNYLFAFVVLILVLVSHIMGMHGLYLKIPVYDIFVHILGGIGIGLFAAAFAKMRDKIKNKRKFVFISVLICGIIWELFEIYFDIAGNKLWTTPYYLDTLKDLVDDMIGAVIVAFSLIRRPKLTP